MDMYFSVSFITAMRKQCNHSSPLEPHLQSNDKWISWLCVFTLLFSSPDHPHLASSGFSFTGKKLLPLSRHYLWGRKKQIQCHFKLIIIIVVIYRDTNCSGGYRRWVRDPRRKALFFTPRCSKQWLKYNRVDGALEHILLELFLIAFLSPSPAAAPVFVTSWGSMRHRLWEES